MSPPVDDMDICPVCNGAGCGVAGTVCYCCGGNGMVPVEVAQDFENERRRWHTPDSSNSGEG